MLVARPRLAEESLAANVTVFMKWTTKFRKCIYLFSVRVHNRTASSIPALASVRSSGEKATAEMPLRCPRKVARSFPVAISHNFTTSSEPPVAIVLPSEERLA